LGASGGGIRRHVRYLAEHPPDGFETSHVAGPAELRVYFSGFDYRTSLGAADIVHVHGLTAAGRVLGRRARPVVVTVHTDIRTQGRTARRPSMQVLARLLVRRADAVISVSQRVAASFPGSQVIAPAFEPLPPPSVSRDEVRADIGTPSDRVVVVTAARLHRDKGLDMFVRAVDGAGADGWICGDGPEREHIESLARGTGVRLLGHRDDIADVFGAADVFALPSVGEAYGIAVAEALQAGLPVIATDAGAMREIAGEAGIVVDAGDEGAFAEAVRKVVHDPALRDDLVHRARSAAPPDPPALVERIGDVYRSVLR
jgi:glycosyltransferase involved in cell wall biosynthesis